MPGEDIEPVGPNWVEDLMDAHDRIAERRERDAVPDMAGGSPGAFPRFWF